MTAEEERKAAAIVSLESAVAHTSIFALRGALREGSAAGLHEYQMSLARGVLAREESEAKEHYSSRLALEVQELTQWRLEAEAAGRCLEDASGALAFAPEEEAPAVAATSWEPSDAMKELGARIGDELSLPGTSDAASAASELLSGEQDEAPAMAAASWEPSDAIKEMVLASRMAEAESDGGDDEVYAAWVGGDPLVAPDGEGPEEAVVRLQAALGRKMARVCILGGTVFENEESEELVKAIAKRLDAGLNMRAWFLTTGMPGIHKVFAKHCGEGSRLWNLLPVGQTSGYGVGTDINAGVTFQQRSEIYAQLGDIYLTFEGGPAVAAEARVAVARGASVLPLQRTGGASSGMYGFPPSALERPAFVSEDQWGLLGQSDVPVAQTAAAVAEIVVGFMVLRDLSAPLGGRCGL